MTEQFYPIGTPGNPWCALERQTWFNNQSVQRSYRDEILDKIELNEDKLELLHYGELSIDPKRYPLIAVKTKDWHPNKPTVLVTGGVHGYETSGVQGAIDFINHHADHASDRVNLLIAPCVSPWGYETINRWNPSAIDPNRSFVDSSPAEESAQLIALIRSTETAFAAHIDLHETTDSDESEFRPALSARDGKAHTPGTVPDGFYLVGDTLNPAPAFQKAIIQSVEKVTHIAPPDTQGNIIGSTVVQKGVINYPCKALGLCAGMTSAPYKTTTEVYPDSPRTSEEECNQAQVAAILAVIDFVHQHTL